MSGGNNDRNHPWIDPFQTLVSTDVIGRGHDAWSPTGSSRRNRLERQSSVPIIIPTPPPTRRNLPDFPRPSSDEQHESLMKKLRKETYHPTAKKLSQRICLYYRDRAKTINQENEKYKDEEGKRCAICLDDFEPREQVIVTPCDHMFHEECIIPWLKSHGKCPICRYKIGEGSQGSENRPPDAANINATDVIAGELLAILGAMEEAFGLGTTAR